MKKEKRKIKDCLVHHSILNRFSCSLESLTSNLYFYASNTNPTKKKKKKKSIKTQIKKKKTIKHLLEHLQRVFQMAHNSFI